MTVAAPLLVIQGSARPDGDTARAVARLRSLLAIDSGLADLSQIEVRPFDYAGGGGADGFDALVDRMIAARSILYATPVYWYAMSGRMKTLFDRFTDLLEDRDRTGRGRALAGRDVRMLAVGADPDLPPGFEAPFRLTADYLGMRWRGSAFVATGSDEREQRELLARFAGEIAAGAG